MDRFRFTTLAHASHDFCNPISAATLDRFVESLALAPGARVLDVGCGKGELLIRVAARWNARGVGLDVNPEFLADARRRAAGRAEVELREVSARDAALEPASFDLTICVGSSHAVGELPEALAALRAWTRPGGQVLFGHGYWKREPDPEYLAGFGGARDELGSERELVAALIAAGFEPLDSATSSPAEWDAYEGAYSANIERFFAEHPGDPDRGAFLARSRSWYALYRRWGRDTMGFALHRLRRA
jgi:SAM-dependent methyltransferase